MKTWIGIPAAVLLMMSASGRAAQAQRVVPTITLDKGATEFAEPFTTLRGVIEMRNGRVLVHDSKEKEIAVIDFAAGTKTRAARTGAGPLEFQSGSFLSGVSDTIVFYDILQSRFLLFSPTGAPLRTVLFGGSDPMASMSRMMPTNVDAVGRVYGQGMGMTMPDLTTSAKFDMKFADTVVIERFDVRTARTDTLARIRNEAAQSEPEMEMSTSGAMRMSMSAPNLMASDVWTVFPDGTIAILRDGNYRVRFSSGPNPPRLGPPIEHVKIPVTAAMKRLVMDSVRAGIRRMMTEMGRSMARGSSSVDPVLPKFDIDVKEPERWAETLPPYESIHVADDRLWVGTLSPTDPLADNASRYDILDRTGALIARVVLARGERIVGHGRGVVYTIRRDDDDLQYLRRYAIRF